MIVCISEDAFLLANGRNQMKTWNLKANKLELIEIQESMGFIQSICCIRRESAPVALAIGTRFNYILMKPMKNDQFDVVVRVRLRHSGSIDSPFSLARRDRRVHPWVCAFQRVGNTFSPSVPIDMSTSGTVKTERLNGQRNPP